MTSTESVVSTLPFTIRRRVRFGECDPAGIVYTARFADYVLSAMELFLSDLLGGPKLQQLGDVQTPMKALRFVFLASMKPDDEFDMVVTVPEIRTRTFDLAVAATLPSGVRTFEAVITPICSTAGDGLRSVPIPETLRTLLTAYQQRMSAHASSLSD